MMQSKPVKIIRNMPYQQSLNAKVEINKVEEKKESDDEPKDDDTNVAEETDGSNG